ncbi:hypothetical protein CH371_05320 [Leptospira wolffii]|uniref:Lipoprotein n=2 Tax=Leptospira wolffii TaxID=409998 RepID=A0A2M9ZG87_9LEPT|nr:hypothetical protein CH371_05320 [Leptospira wolffii]
MRKIIINFGKFNFYKRIPMKRIFVLPLLLLLLLSCKSTSRREKPEYMNGFKEKLAETKLLIRQVVPPNFRLIAKDPKVPYRYDYALRSDDDQIEIRYIVKSVPGLLKEIAEIKKKDPSAVMITPKKDDYLIHYAVFLQNLGGENAATGYTEFPPKAVKDEFGADWGSSVSFEMRPGSDSKFKYCSITALHKDNLADVYILYLSEDPDKLIQFMKNTYLFYNLRFM